MSFVAGDELEWMYTPRGGYGYTQRVPCTFVKYGPKKVQIAALTKRGGVKTVWVDPKNLRRAQ